MKGINQEINQKVIGFFIPIAALALSLFAATSFFILEDYFWGTSQLISLFILLFIIPGFLKRGKNLVAGNFIAFIGMLTIMPWLITGGYANLGFMWSIVYIVGVYFITIKRHAIMWFIIYLCVALTIVLLSNYGYCKIAYSNPQLINLLTMYIFTFAFINQFNYVREYYLQISLKKEKELSQKNAELQAVNVELAQFAYVASHDLQEPLLTISGFVNVLETKYALKGDKETDAYYGFITEAVKRMQLLISDLLNLSRIGTNTSLSSFRVVDTNKVLKQVLLNLTSSITENKAKITSDKLPFVIGNETELNLLFHNLISNAIKFRKKNESPEIKIAVRENENEYIFSIKDNGMGVDEKYVERIFAIFQRLHSREEYPGNGIGLSICKKIVTLHNGTIWLKSKLNEGSIFYFSISKQNVV